MSWVAVAVGVGGAAAGMYGANKAAKASKPTNDQRAIEGQIATNLKGASPYGLDFLKQGSANMQVFNDFYRKLATGDRAGALQLLAPQFTMADQQNAAGMQADLTLAPRSGGSAEGRLAGMDASKMNRENSILSLRTDAVDTLGAFGGEQVAMGNSLLGQSSGSGLGLLGALQQRRNSGFDQSRAIGQGMFDIIKLLGTGYANRSGSGSTGAASQFTKGNSGMGTSGKVF
jgi:hypothetical protein